jgi:hypothetical protein
MVKNKQSDGLGGTETVWTEGGELDAYCRMDAPVREIVGDKVVEKSTYTIITKEGTMLDFRDVIKRIRDGKLFRATSDGDDYKLPSMSTIKLNKVTAEELSALPV